MGKIPGVCPLQTYYPRIGPQLPRQLSIAHIHGVDLLCPVLEHTVGKAAGGGPDITADIILQINGKHGHGLFKLQPAPAHIGHSAAPYFNFLVRRIGGSGLVRPLALYKHQSAHDDRLRLLPTIQQAPLHQQQIQPLFFTHAMSSPRNGAVSSPDSL
ncbi:hypothetical protein SDC9_140767 [bioreactor metagenome]|uniref:Uncharacterized protein n=1 Tax=bioreactor metagenome TaxID=1076179 RepID=A0A645DW76_9ZZZZ